MRELLDVLKAVETLLDQPAARALGVVLAVVSFFLTLFLAKRQMDLASARKQHIVFEQATYIQDLWQETNSIILSNPQHLTIMKELWGYRTEDEVMRSCIIFNQLNPVYTAYRTREHVNRRAQTHYDGELESVLRNFTGDQPWLIATLKERGYGDEFANECDCCLTKLRSADSARLG